MFRTVPRRAHRAPGRAVIDYRGLAVPVGRSVGGVAAIGAVSATAALSGGTSATAQAPAAPAAAVGAVRAAAPVVVPAAPAPSQFTSVKLRYGARGAAVTHLQKQLNAQGASIAADGVFGSATLRAVKNHQSSAGLGVDGWWDVLGDPRFVFDLRNGRDPRPRTVARVRAFLEEATQ